MNYDKYYGKDKQNTEKKEIIFKNKDELLENNTSFK